MSGLLGVKQVDEWVAQCVKQVDEWVAQCVKQVDELLGV